jgi:hypothetical protein
MFLSGNGIAGGEFINVDDGWGRGRGRGRGRGGRGSGGRGGGFRGHVREQDSGGYEETSGNMTHRTDPRKYTNCLLIYNNMKSYAIMI